MSIKRHKPFKQRTKRPLTNKTKRRKRTIARKSKPQITVVYGKLYSVKCGHCIMLDPIWKKVDEHFKQHNFKFPHSHVMYKEVSIENTHLDLGIAEANNTYLSNSSTKIESPIGFPTIFRIYDGKLEYFDGNRDYNTLVRWFSRRPSVVFPRNEERVS